MPSFISSNFSRYAAESFVEGFSLGSVYLYVGKGTVWSDDTTPPSANDTPADHAKIWDNMAGVVRVNRNQVILGIARNNWTSGVIYERHNDISSTLGSGTGFYVLAGSTDRDVYLCLDNDYDAQSSVKPTHKTFGTTREVDGYVWKYLYTISAITFNKFATDSVLPVGTHPTVTGYAKAGSIITVPLSANSQNGIGAYYRGSGFSNGTQGIALAGAYIDTTVSSSSPTNAIKLAASVGLSNENNYYNNCAFLVTSGLSTGSVRIIQDYVASTNTITLSSPVNSIENGDTFQIGPRVTVDNRYTGIGFLGIGNVNGSGNLTSVTILNTGGGYANSDISFNVLGDYNPAPTHPDGSGAIIDITIPPIQGGHGYSAAADLNAKFAIVSAETVLPTNDQTGTFSGPRNEIRQIGLLRNPLDSGKQTALGTSYDMRTTLYITQTGITLSEDEEIVSETGKAIVWDISGTSGSQYITVTNKSGSFANGDTITGSGGGGQYIINNNGKENYQYPIGSTNNPESPVMYSGLTKYSGQIIYHENIQPIARRSNQKENFKFVFEF